MDPSLGAALSKFYFYTAVYQLFLVVAYFLFRLKTKRQVLLIFPLLGLVVSTYCYVLVYPFMDDFFLQKYITTFPLIGLIVVLLTCYHIALFFWIRTKLGYTD